ncbi:hypothetical protein [uncultured Helicobacter sp.]|uniref:hypothetical protein n=1 Tax=uncultured Helicobacter sp. TaxID=175537 RepID=UPI00262B5910|nr:hypothetical protein [uncultured Helicobacter sp.]
MGLCQLSSLIKYNALDFEKSHSKGTIYKISHDYQIEKILKILWNKKNKALESLKSHNVQTPNLLKKIMSLKL